jgi:hypothetical protein
MPFMRSIFLVASVLSLTLVPAGAAAQRAHSVFLVAGEGGGGTEVMEPEYAVNVGYTREFGDAYGPYWGARYTFGMHRLRADEQALRDRYGAGTGTVSGGGGTLYDTGGDVEVGYGVGGVRAYGFAGIHYYRQSHEDVTLQSGGGGVVRVVTGRSDAFANSRGLGVQLRWNESASAVAEWYRGGGHDGIMRIDGVRFGVRWTF